MPKKNKWLAPTLIALPLLCLGSETASWIEISRDHLCVTEGAIDSAAHDRLSVNVPKMRAYATEWSSQSAKLIFTYLGGTGKESALGSGAIRRQFGLKLRAQDSCNLVYAMWRIEPESKLVVSVKTNPGAHTSTECGNRGYENINPLKSSPVPHLQAGQSHTLSVEMKNSELSVFVDNREVWQGDVGPTAAKLDGPIGIRSDNAHLEFELRTPTPHETSSGHVRACKAGSGDD
jgi:hypothetical protein